MSFSGVLARTRSGPLGVFTGLTPVNGARILSGGRGTGIELGNALGRCQRFCHWILTVSRLTNIRKSTDHPLCGSNYNLAARLRQKVIGALR